MGAGVDALGDHPRPDTERREAPPIDRATEIALGRDRVASANCHSANPTWWDAKETLRRRSRGSGKPHLGHRTAQLRAISAEDVTRERRLHQVEARRENHLLQAVVGAPRVACDPALHRAVKER